MAKKKASSANPKADDKKLQEQETILGQFQEFKKDQAKVQNLQAQASDIIDKMPEASEVDELLGQLEVARDKLNKAKQNNKELDEVLENLAVARSDMRASSNSLSAMLVKWANQYAQRNVLIGTAMHEIVLNAKLGKELENQQESLPLW